MYVKFKYWSMILGLVAGEMGVLEEDQDLFRYGTEPRLQIYPHSSANPFTPFVYFEWSRREELGPKLWRG